MPADLKGRGQRLLARLPKSVSREQLRAHADVVGFAEFGAPEHLLLPDSNAVDTSNPQWIRDNLALWKPSWPAPFVCGVNDVRLLGSLYLGVTRRNEVILETTRTAGSPYLLWPKITRRTLRNALSLPAPERQPWSGDPIATLFHVSQDSYFHWFTDVIATIEGVRHYEAASGQRVRFVVNRPSRPWQREALALLGVHDSDVVSWDGACAPVSRLVVSSVRTDGWTCLPSIDSLRWIRTEMMRSAPLDKPTAANIYVRRLGSRRFTNEDEVTALMESRGIVPVELERMSIVEQIRLFRGARLIVGSHGAGLTNLIFSDRAEVVELFGAWKSLCYATIAGGFGHHYHGVDLLPEVGFQSGHSRRVDDVAADLSRVAAAVDGALERIARH